MNACTLCDAPCQDDEALCPSCLADPAARAAYDALARESRGISAASRWRSAARAALQRARAFRAEGGAHDARALACVAEAARCRDEAHRARAGAAALPARGPGLHKAGLPGRARRTRRGTG